MQPVNVDGLAQYLGPGTGGLFMGEQQRNAMQESEINQQKGLEDILNQRQTRDIQKQKLPFELQQAEQNVLKTKGEVAAQGTAAEDRLEKLDKQRVTDFMGAVLEYQGVDNPLDNAFQLQALAQKYKLDGNDPRIRSIMMNSMDKAGIKKMQQALIESDPKWQADRKKAEEEKAKSDAEIAGRRDVAHIQGGYSVQRENIRAKAKASAQAKTQSILQITKGDPVKTIAALVTEGNRLLKEGKVDEASALFEAANDPVLRTAASNQQANAGKLTVGPDGQLATTGASAPLPQAGPRQPGAAPAPAAATQPAGKISYQGQEYEVLEQLPDGRVKIRDPKTGRTGTITQ